MSESIPAIVHNSISLVDLKAQFLDIKDEIKLAINAVLESCAFTDSAFVQDFEANFALAHQSKFCIGVNNGTSALHLILMALNITAGDEVIVPTNSFFATAEAVSLCGAKPIFVDCEPNFYNIDVEKIEEKITNRTKAVIAVHLYGQAANIKRLLQIAEAYNIHLIEDCAQAHLTTYHDKPVGTFGVASGFSFYPGKNLGAYGEAGAILTQDGALASKMQALRNHGSQKKYYHDYVGHNYRMESIQAAVLKVKLNYLATWTKHRQKMAELYRKLLSDLPIELPAKHVDGDHVYHLYVIRVKKREDLMYFLSQKGIQTGVHYPIPCHQQKAYNTGESFPISEKYASEILSLPMHSHLSVEQVEMVALAIREFYTTCN